HDARRVPRASGDPRGVHDPDRAAVSGARLAAHAVRLLGPVEGPVAIAVPPRLGAHLGTHLSAAAEGDVPTAAVVAFLGSARGLAALGFTVERLRLACGERAQLVVARRPAP